MVFVRSESDCGLELGWLWVGRSHIYALDNPSRAVTPTLGALDDAPAEIRTTTGVASRQAFDAAIRDEVCVEGRYGTALCSSAPTRRVEPLLTVRARPRCTTPIVDKCGSSRFRNRSAPGSRPNPRLDPPRPRAHEAELVASDCMGTNGLADLRDSDSWRTASKRGHFSGRPTRCVPVAVPAAAPRARLIGPAIYARAAPWVATRGLQL